MLCLRFAAFIVSWWTANAGLTFLTIGDWGGAALEEPSQPWAKNTAAVAKQLGKSVADKNVKFIVNTGDNFYWCGLQNSSDFQVAKDWLDTYPQNALDIPWYGVLGNHEYGYNVDAQIELSKKYKNWIMDARYYSRRVQLEGSNYATFIFLDTSPCVSEYRGSDPERWDPCGTQYHTCSLSGGKDDFEGKCNFNQNILTQDCSKQYDWYKSELAKVPKDDWLIIVAHHPADEVDVEDMTSLMQQHGFDLYLNGHAHVLTQYSVDGNSAYVTSGAGALVLSQDQMGGSPAKDRTYNKVHDVNRDFMANVSKSYSGHNYHAIFNAHKSGFTIHTFSDDYKTLDTQYLDTDGNILHTFTVTKGTAPSPGPSPPGPSPGPSPPGPSPGKCCYTHDSAAACKPGMTCCSGSGKSYQSEDTCKRYGAKHNCVWKDSICVIPDSDLISI